MTDKALLARIVYHDGDPNAAIAFDYSHDPAFNHLEHAYQSKGSFIRYRHLRLGDKIKLDDVEYWVRGLEYIIWPDDLGEGSLYPFNLEILVLIERV